MSAGSEQELRDEIQYLTKLIKSHSNKVIPHKKPGTSVRGNADVYKWTNRASTKVTTSKEPKSPKALHYNASAGIQSEMHAYRHPMLRQVTGQGRFVYKPKQSLPLPLNKSKHVEFSTPMAAATPQLSKPMPSEADYLGKTGANGRSAVSVGGKHKLQQSSSQFNVYHGAAQSSKKMSTVVSMNPPESKSPASYPSTSSFTSTKRKDTDGQVSCSHSGNSDSRKRKRKVSASRQFTSAAKKSRSQHSSVLKSSKYVWLAKNTSQKYKSNPQVSKHHPPNSSQFKLEASADQPQSKEAKALITSPVATIPTAKLPTVRRTPNLSSVPVAVSRSNRKLCKGTSRVRTPVNSKYRWRRRLSSSGSRKVQRGPSSPLVVQSRYKLTRASLLEKHPATSSRKRFSSFTQRRVDYILQNSLRPYSTKQLHLRGSTAIKARPAKSKNKVWVASSGMGTCLSDSEEPLGLAVQPLQTLASGHESKTRQGNKQWVSAHAKDPARGLRTRKRSTHTRKQLGLRTPLAASSKVVMDASGRRMTRIPSSSRLTWRKTSTSGSLSVNRMLASHAVRRSKAYVWHSKQRSKRQGKSKQYCMFFNRFGKCNKMATCPYIHDPDKVAICTKFLRGMCDRTNGTCPFSHKISKAKMPVCSFFLRGVCTRDDCPYVHVSVGRDAEVCQDFLRGYCPSGEQCTKLHTLDCPEFFRTGSCSGGSACPMRHRRRSSKPSQKGGATTIKEPFAFKVARHRKDCTTSHCHLPSTGCDDSVLITPAELDFIPLDQDYAYQCCRNLTNNCFREETGNRVGNAYTYPIIDTFGHCLWKAIAPEPNNRGIPNLEVRRVCSIGQRLRPLPVVYACSTSTFDNTSRLSIHYLL